VHQASENGEKLRAVLIGLDLPSVPIRLRRLRTKENQDYPADHRKKVQKLPPPATVDIVQASRGDRDAGQKRHKGKYRSQIRSVAVTIRVKANHHQNSGRDAQPLKLAYLTKQA
jgi:hypothetical protein